MDLWTARNGNKLLAASSDPKLREKILTFPHEGEWTIVQGRTATDKTRILELIEGAEPIQETISTATYYVENGKVNKRREKGDSKGEGSGASAEKEAGTGD